MKRSKNYLRIISEFLLFGILIVILIIFVNFITQNQQLSTIEPQTSLTSAYPPPKQGIETSYPPPIEKTLTPAKSLDPNQNYFPSITPFPITPYPTLTLKPGPSSTPIPIIGPSKDAAGSIFFIAKGEKDAKASPYSLNVDAYGKIVQEKTLLSTDDLQSEGFVFPSPNGKLIAITGNWGTLKIYNVELSKFEPNAPMESKFANSHVVAFFGWLPDNQRILYRDGFGNLILADPLSGDVTPLVVPGYGSVDGAAASPDGQFVVYSLNSLLYPKGIWIVNTNGQNAHLLNEKSYSATNMSWSPDGKRIAFYAGGWFVIDAEGTNLRKLTSGISIPNCFFLPALWSPDSVRLAIVSEQNGDAFCYGWREQNFKGTNIILIDVDTGKNHPILSDGSTGNIDPTWSPDGSRIAFTSNRSGTPEIWIMDVNGLNLRQMTANNILVRFPAWRK